jgi:SlyX protein
MAPLPDHTPRIQDHPMIEERLEKLETKISYQEDQIEELNKTVYQQQQKLDRLESICEALARELRALGEAGGDGKSPANERPPHY